MIEATPLGLGRKPDAVATISASTGLTVVHVTGAHRANHYGDDGAILRTVKPRWLTRSSTRSRTECRPSASTERPASPWAQPGIRSEPGMVKIGIGYWRIASFERRVLAAAAAAHRRTGISVMVHLNTGQPHTKCSTSCEPRAWPQNESYWHT